MDPRCRYLRIYEGARLICIKSIDLTRLPKTRTSSALQANDSENTENYDYSSREVSPPGLLIQELVTANRTFLLHHGPTISDLFLKLSRDKFCNTLERYWARFCRDWEVLLHGNPAVHAFGGLKLAAGGELGIGVGEEDWGSGEREVLEDLVRQTEGMVDLSVSMFGEAAPTGKHETDSHDIDKTYGLPWLGCGKSPQAHDGVVFGGIGALSRPSLRDISVWVQQIYTYGEYAYGVKDNPHRQRRKRRRPNPRAEHIPEDDEAETKTPLSAAAHTLAQQQGIDPKLLPHDPRPQLHDRVASHDHATGEMSPQVASHPGIPPPIVTATENALDKAITAAADRQKNASPEPAADWKSTLGSSKTWMKYLTLGLSSGKAGASSHERPQAERAESTSSTVNAGSIGKLSPDQRKRDQRDEGTLQYIEPAPDGHELAAQLAHQRLQEEKGHFLIGLKGDLDVFFSDETDDADVDAEDAGERMVLRTVQVELTKQQSYAEEVDDALSRRSSHATLESTRQSARRRLRVLVYVHRPFIFTLLFDERAPVLTMSSFYKSLHRHLAPLHKPLLSSTSVAKVAERIAQSHQSVSERSSSIDTRNPPYEPPKTSPVFDLVFDPLTLTIHTSIPNIPDAGTPAAEGIATTSSGKYSPPPWTRIEALNVHSQILHTLADTKFSPAELERTSKTTRGWWIVWMRLPSSAATVDADADADADADSAGSTRRAGERVENVADCRQAFLVRKASDYVSARGASAGSRVGSGMFGLGSMGMGLGLGRSEEGGSSSGAGWGPGALAGGIGVDARRYVEGLLSLNR